MKLSQISKTQVDLKKYNAQATVRRSSKSNLSYDNIAIMTDADVDG